jgi:hypothetical protein
MPFALRIDGISGNNPLLDENEVFILAALLICYRWRLLKVLYCQEDD